MGDLDMYKSEEGDRPVERSPRGRYIRFDVRLGSGAYKTVWKAYDTDQGIDVAWNAIDIGVLPSSEKSRIIQEVQLLQKLEHKNIINFYGSWFSKEKNQVVFITEIMTSGNLKSYIKRVHFVKWKIIKRWCIQILEGLHYLHSSNPPVIHRDLKCDNIFINGNTGDLRIGDLGLSTQLAVHKRSKAQSVLGTPEFMAPELYDESYDEKVDIYAFGMCVLEMVTKEVPYSECINPAQIYKKVTAGIRPRGMQRIISQPARDFIELCLSRGNGKVDVSAEYLLNHPFLKAHEDDGEMVQVLDEDELERDPPPLPLAPPPMNPKQFADELNMESGSKGNDDTVVSDRRKNNTSLSLEPEELATGSANSSMAVPLVQVQRDDIPAEEKSAGKQRMLLPPKVLTDTAPNPATLARQPSTLPPLPPSAPSSGNSEPIVDEPLSDKKGADHHVDNFLSGLPPTERNIRNDRIAVMGGRGHRIEIDEAQAYSDDESSTPPTTDPPPVLAAVTVQGHGSEISSSSESSHEARPRANTLDVSRSGRPPSAPKKRGKRYDIKATKDPDNEHSILLNLRMSLDGKSKEIKFPFNLFTDNSHEVACELAVDVGILEPDLEDIADSISFLVTEGKINNLPDFDQDVWDEAPEPHSFPSKPLPHVSKLTFESLPNSQVILTSMDMGTSSVGSLAPATSPVQPVTARESSTGSNNDGSNRATAETAFMSSSPNPFGVDRLMAPIAGPQMAHAVSETGSYHPPIGTPLISHAASESALYNPEGFNLGESREHTMSIGSAAEAHYLQSVRLHEDRMKLARSSYDERESSLEEAMRNQEEKHQREIERIRMKMQEFNEKTARATQARQERMRLGTDEFREDGEGASEDGRLSFSQAPSAGDDQDGARSSPPTVLPQNGSATASDAVEGNVDDVRSPCGAIDMPEGAGPVDPAVPEAADAATEDSAPAGEPTGAS